ncbi:transposase [Streptomyces bottropensis ATCC 25435]|uniref:Transposase n=1 Tax=Streptomyces bottropensis ATCC 25435 TaxID=1054862 RepID=M3FYH3_9ACTN|nr:transposase [Streptomyces bottropensis ATCC 25435]
MAWEVDQWPAGFVDQRAGRPGGGVLVVLGEVAPPLKQNGDIRRDAFGRRLFRLAVDVAVVQVTEDLAGSLVIRRLSPSQTARS